MTLLSLTFPCPLIGEGELRFVVIPLGCCSFLFSKVSFLGVVTVAEMKLMLQSLLFELLLWLFVPLEPEKVVCEIGVVVPDALSWCGLIAGCGLPLFFVGLDCSTAGSILMSRLILLARLISWQISESLAVGMDSS